MNVLLSTLTFSLLFVQNIAKTNAIKNTKIKPKKIFAKANIFIEINFMEVAKLKKLVSLNVK